MDVLYHTFPAPATLSLFYFMTRAEISKIVLELEAEGPPGPQAGGSCVFVSYRPSRLVSSAGLNRWIISGRKVNFTSAP